MNTNEMHQRALKSLKAQVLDVICKMMKDNQVTVADIEAHLETYKSTGEQVLDRRKARNTRAKRINNAMLARKGKKAKTERLAASANRAEVSTEPTEEIPKLKRIQL